MTEEHLFDLALNASDAERAALLDRECAGDAGLRARIEALLRADAKPNLTIDSPINRTGSYAERNEAAGVVIAGKYKLVEPIGEGGMGSVWLAEQSEPVRRRVALKLIKAGMDSKQVISRFEAERQALAVMDHPNIAKVLDGGLHEGRPYFVMELVKGVPITQYCDARKLTPRERLELFVPVCQAIQHAHQKGIIHRDIKPSNVLVAPYDDRPVPKVIDFGLAKATGVALTDASQATNFGGVVGTPQYMSPEQASLNNLDIDTRSDIYSLGILLYELLTGSPPFKRKDLEKAGMLEILRVIREEEPPRPSTKLSTADALPSLSANRGTEPKKLTGILRNELDWIVMKALEKDRVRRYETANGFAADINRYLTGEPVLAHPPSAGYRMKKLLRKHKGTVFATTAVAGALLVGLVGFAWQARVAQNERNVAETERDRAIDAKTETKKRADELKLVSDFQAQMLGQVDPTEAGILLTQDVKAKFEAALGKAGMPEDERKKQVVAFATRWHRVNATDAARELIDRTILKPAVTAIDKQFADQPVVDATLRQVLATRYRDIGLHAAAAPLQERALATRRRVLGDMHPDTLHSVAEMGVLLMSQGKLNEAEPYCREALEKMRRVLGEEHANTLNAIDTMAGLRGDQGKLNEAEELFREAVNKKRRVLGEEHTSTLRSINNMATLLGQQGKHTEAEQYFREVLDKNRRVRGETDPETLTSIANLGEFLTGKGRSKQAEPYLREALDKFRRVLGEEHPHTLNAINFLAGLLHQQGKLTEAELCYREALEKRRRVLGDEHPDTLVSIANMGMLLEDQKKFDEAEFYLREALDKHRRILGEEHPNTLNSIHVMGTFLQNQGKPAEAEPYIREALAKRRRFLGDEHPDTLMSINGLAGLVAGQGKLKEAVLLFESAAVGMEQRKFQHEYAGLIMTNAIYFFEHLKEFERAEPWRRKWIVVVKERAGPESPGYASQLAELGMNLLEQNKYVDAEPVLRDCLAIREKKQPDVWRTFSVKSLLGASLLGQKKLADAEPLLIAGYEGMRQRADKIPPQGKIRLTEDVERLGQLYTAWHSVEPNKGYDVRAAEWKTKLQELKSTVEQKAAEKK